MKKLLARIIGIGLGSGILIFFTESARSTVEDAFWVASLSAALILIGASFVLLLLRFSTRPDLRLDERVIKEDWCTYMSDSGETAEGIGYLTDTRILFKHVGFAQSAKSQIYLELDRISEVSRSGTKLTIDTDGIVHYFFINDSRSWEEFIKP